MLHFDNVTTFRAKEGHSAIKRQLRFSIDDLKTVIDNIDLLLKNQLQKYRIVMNEAKSRISHHIRISILRDLIIKMSSFALRQILKQYHRIADENLLSRCINIFKNIMRLSCAYIMQQRLHESFNQLTLADIHFK